MKKEIFTQKELKEMEAMHETMKNKQAKQQAIVKHQNKQNKAKKIKNYALISALYITGLTIVYLLACYIEKIN